MRVKLTDFQLLMNNLDDAGMIKQISRDYGIEFKLILLPRGGAWLDGNARVMEVFAELFDFYADPVGLDVDNVASWVQSARSAAKKLRDAALQERQKGAVTSNS